MILYKSIKGLGHYKNYFYGNRGYIYKINAMVYLKINMNSFVSLAPPPSPFTTTSLILDDFF
ncbi:hypothetical protein CLERM_502 [Coxiella-like endosymbiont]|nr:hypothetical protein CLERM_502 [Coxiella-like endosymbiont]